MTPIYNREGRVVAWWVNNRYVLDGGVYAAFSHGDTLYSMRGKYRGRLQSGFFRDRSGDAVAFVNGASGGPPLPSCEAHGPPPVPPLPPIVPLPTMAPEAPAQSQRWGSSWEEFLYLRTLHDLLDDLRVQSASEVTLQRFKNARSADPRAASEMAQRIGEATARGECVARSERASYSVSAAEAAALLAAGAKDTR